MLLYQVPAIHLPQHSKFDVFCLCVYPYSFMYVVMRSVWFLISEWLHVTPHAQLCQEGIAGFVSTHISLWWLPVIGDRYSRFTGHWERWLCRRGVQVEMSSGVDENIEMRYYALWTDKWIRHPPQTTRYPPLPCHHNVFYTTDSTDGHQ